MRTLAAFIVVLILAGCAGPAATTPRWEYWYATGSDQTPGKGLHIVAQQPDDTWELVSVVKTGEEYGFFFKRQKP